MSFSVLQRKFDNLLTNNFIISMCRYWIHATIMNSIDLNMFLTKVLHLQLNPIPHGLFLIVIFMKGGGADAAQPLS